ncbi:MAG: response regulator transcription factor [Erysipelothrix sp.]|nr:response regulator transcription factor [Erysipelothrix sp.]
MQTILIVEDEEVIRLGLEYILKQEGFSVVVAPDGLEAIDIFNEHPEIDLILLDLNLPDIHGYNVLESVRAQKETPVIILSAVDLETSIVQGLDMGADDYIMKPFKTRELISRINSVLRRHNRANSNIINLQNLTIDINQGKVFKNGVDVFLSTLEYKILLMLALNPNEVFSRDQILSNIWDIDEAYVFDNTLSVYIKRVREKIEDDYSNPKIIITVRGKGYMIEEYNDK